MRFPQVLHPHADSASHKAKVLTISGSIQNITGSGQQALVTLVGYKPPNMDDQGFQDVVRCTVTDSDALAKVMDLKKDQATKVTGLFKPDQDVLGIGCGLQTASGGLVSNGVKDRFLIKTL